MPRTIVQKYGPIYGEAVNGTVQGRPNGSVYVPISNTINLTVDTLYIKYRGDGRMRLCKSDGTFTATTELYHYDANSQDLSSYVQLELFSDEELTTREAWRLMNAGIFNYDSGNLYQAVGELEDGDPVYLVAYLMNNGTKVATSDVYTLTMVVP